MYKYKNGSNLRKVPFYQQGTPEGGINLDFDLLGFTGFIPVYGTYQLIKRAVRNPNLATIGAASLGALGDILTLTGVGAVGSTAMKAARLANGLSKSKGLLKGLKSAKNLKKLLKAFPKDKHWGTSFLKQVENEALKGMTMGLAKNADEAVKFYNEFLLMVPTAVTSPVASHAFEIPRERQGGLLKKYQEGSKFDPNKGYNESFQRYLFELSKLKKRINVSKARKYFDKRWQDDSYSRELLFNLQNASNRLDNIIQKYRNDIKNIQLEADRDVEDLQTQNLQAQNLQTLTALLSLVTPETLYLSSGSLNNLNSLKFSFDLDWSKAYRLDNYIFDPIPNYLSEKAIKTPKLSLGNGRSASNEKLTLLMLLDLNLKSSNFDPMGAFPSLDLGSIQRVNEVLKKLGYNIDAYVNPQKTVEDYNNLYKRMFGEGEYNKLLKFMRGIPVSSNKYGGRLNKIPFYQLGNSLISKHPSSKNTSEYAADSAYYDNVIKKFGDPLKRFDIQYLLDNNEFGYDQNEEWRTSSDGNKWRNGDYYNPKYGISSYVDTVNSKGEKYREINIDEPGGGLDKNDSFTPVYRFIYKYDLKLGKYIPTNEWFMDKVIYRKQGGNLNKLPFMLKGTYKSGIRTIEDVDTINESNRNTAKGLFKGMISGRVLPTMQNIGRMLTSAYLGYLDPEITAQHGTAIIPGVPKNFKEALQLSLKISKLKNPLKPLYENLVNLLKKNKKEYIPFRPTESNGRGYINKTTFETPQQYTEEGRTPIRRLSDFETYDESFPEEWGTYIDEIK